MHNVGSEILRWLERVVFDFRIEFFSHASLGYVLKVDKGVKKNSNIRKVFVI